MHKARWITGLTALPFLVGLISWGGVTLFMLVVAAVSILGVHESFRLLFSGHGSRDFESDPGPAGPGIPLRILAYGAGPLILYGAFRGAPLMMIFYALNLMIAGLIAMTQFDGEGKVLEPVFRQTFTVLYVPVLLAFLVLIRNGDKGAVWIYLMLAVVFAGDIGAFYVGTYFGKHKLCPSISPKKTIEGGVGGLASNLVVGLLMKIIFLPELPLGLSVVFFITLGIAAQMGDLFESMLKRAAKVKDSGGIFPGHGGLLDRIDALLFAAPVGYLFKEYLLR
ncbi:MAG: phosphatidate cytidylyltransferase [Desulfobacterales bacterium CG07_land_8_20_14_0_80_52_14]|nr:MAG: phosphatidate cytidylyltransferase [Desulfobacterales bacterium CG23_combo_of_CG06-09_8_20_14_all_52_9]PIU49889.1 MAG: phosphatidate cytidylyltransferase [Desulfobacterales bacterium CG07_land_8_20_14_0_80_52_14]